MMFIGAVIGIVGTLVVLTIDDSLYVKYNDMRNDIRNHFFMNHKQ